MSATDARDVSTPAGVAAGACSPSQSPIATPRSGQRVPAMLAPSARSRPASFW